MTVDVATVTILCTSIASLVGVVLNAILAYLREGRSHDWQVAEREARIAQSDRDQAERLRVAQELKAHTAQQAAEVLAVNVKAIEAGEKAYTEANNLSLKIHAEGLQLRAPSRETDR